MEKDVYGRSLTKEEEFLRESFGKASYSIYFEKINKIGDFTITHRANISDPIATFHPQTIICLSGTFKKKVFVAIFGTDYGWAESLCAIVIGKLPKVTRVVKGWLKKDSFLRSILPRSLRLELQPK